MQMILQPTVSLKSSRFSSNNNIKVKLLGTCSVQLAEDTYNITLPKLLLKSPTGLSTQVELAGEGHKPVTAGSETDHTCPGPCLQAQQPWHTALLL